MKAVAVFPKTRRVEVVEHPEPRVTRPTEVRLRMLEVGVCGTDREISSFEYGTPPAGSDYLVIGHESLGEVVEVGRAVRSLKRGDLVVPMVRRPCSHDACVPCRAGRQDFCTTGEFSERGIKESHGFFAESVVDDERYMVPVARELRDCAVLVEPLTIAEKAIGQIRDVQKRLPWSCHAHPGEPAGHCHKALVLGAGPVGLLGAMALRVAGFDTFVYSREDPGSPKAKLVAEIGGRYLSGAKLQIGDLMREIGNIDVVYEATGASRVAFELLKELGVNGLFVFTGVPGRKAPIEVDTDLLMRNLVLKNQVLLGTVNAGRETFEAAVADLGEFRRLWPAAVEALITERQPLSMARELLLGAPRGIKSVVTLAQA